MTDGVRRLSHDDAELLISSRMDEQLDRVDSRALLVHLQTCESCRVFAVQSEVLGRELNTLPVLPPSALVDRQIRESIAKGRSRWSLASLMPATAGNSGLRVAVGALAMLTLVSVFLLVRMAGNQSGQGTSIEAPNGAIAQQLDRSPTQESASLGQVSGPTETPRLVVPKTPESEASGPGASTETAGRPTDVAVAPAEKTSAAQAEPTRTLDPAFVYSVDNTQTPASDNAEPTNTEIANDTVPTETSVDVAVAAVMVDDGTPVDGSDPSETPERESPVSTATFTTPDDTDTTGSTETPSVPTEQPSAEVTMTAEAPKEETATQQPATSTAQPTATATPVEISVDATETTINSAAPPTSDDSTAAIAVVSPESPVSPPAEGTPSGEPMSTPLPSDVLPPSTPTETPAAPFTQPTIAPMAGVTGGDQGTGESINGEQSPQIVANDGTDADGLESEDAGDNGQSIEFAGGQPQSPDDGQGTNGDQSNNGDSGSSPPIVPSDDKDVPNGVGGDSNQTGSGSAAQQPTAVPTVDASIAPSGLDLSDTVTDLPSGTTAPAGRLEFSPGMNLYVVIAPDGQLAVADLSGELVVTFGSGDLPVWSGGGLMFRTQGEAGAEVGIWNSDTGDVSYVPPSENEASDDVPIGGNGSAFYFLRTYPGSGIVELRSATIDGSDNGVLWTSDEVTLGGARPVYSEIGIYLPTDSAWLLIDSSGNESLLGENPYGSIGAPVLSPGGGLMAYSVGDEVIVAWSTDPGTAVATAPFSAAGGYAFATSGEEIVISDGSSLHVISYLGEDLGTLGGNQPIGTVYWISDTIYYLQIGEDAALMSTTQAAIESE